MAKAKPAEPVKPVEPTTPAPVKETPKSQVKQSHVTKGAPRKDERPKQQPKQQEKKPVAVETVQPKKPTAPPPVWVGLQKFKEKQAASQTPNTATTPSGAAEKQDDNIQQVAQPNGSIVEVAVHGADTESKPQADGALDVDAQHQLGNGTQPDGVQIQSNQANVIQRVDDLVQDKVSDKVKAGAGVTPVKTVTGQVSNQLNGTTAATVPKQPITFGPQGAKLNANLVQAQPFVPPSYLQQQVMYLPPHALGQQPGNFIPGPQGYYPPQGYYGMPTPYGQPMHYNGNPYMQYPPPGPGPHPLPPYMLPNQQYTYYQSGYPATNVPQ